MPGVIDASGISGSLDAKNIVMGVLQKGVELSNLVSICKQIQVPELTANIPVSAAPSVDEDLLEYESSEIQTGAFTDIAFSLLKDRIKLAVSDEATYKSKAGDPLSIQIEAAGMQLANILDKKIVAALMTTPQTHAGTDWGTATNNPFVEMGLAVSKILPYKADYVIMNPTNYSEYLGSDTLESAITTVPAAFNGAIGKVPGLNLDIFVSSHATLGTAIVGSSTGFSAVVGNGPVKVRTWDDENTGTRIYQMDVWRQVKAPIFLTAGSLNQSVCTMTGL